MLSDLLLNLGKNNRRDFGFDKVTVSWDGLSFCRLKGMRLNLHNSRDFLKYLSVPTNDDGLFGQFFFASYWMSSGVWDIASISRQLRGKITKITFKVHKNENFFGFDFEFCTISLLVMSKY
jgi:hypothetical protein